MNENNINRPFIGTWRLQDWLLSTPDGQCQKAFGGKAEGFLIYTAEGTVSATLFESGRPNVENWRQLVPTLKEKWALGSDEGFSEDEKNLVKQYFSAGTGYVAYVGKYWVDDKAKSVHHDVEAAFLPQMIGMDLVRKFDFEANILTLTAEPTNSLGITDQLIWEKI